jgi:NaMN:DMB phosphoribosyltransferase
LDLDLRVTDPGFGEATTPGLARYAEGEAKEGVGMGGALALAEDRGVTMATVRERAAEILERCLAEAP